MEVWDGVFVDEGDLHTSPGRFDGGCRPRYPRPDYDQWSGFHVRSLPVDHLQIIWSLFYVRCACAVRRGRRLNRGLNGWAVMPLPFVPFHPLPSRERGHPHPTEHRVRSLRYASPWIIVNISRLAFMVLRLIIDR